MKGVVVVVTRTDTDLADQSQVMDQIRQIDSDFDERIRRSDIRIYNLATGDGTHETMLSEEEEDYLFDSFLSLRKEMAKAKKCQGDDTSAA
ncbi:MAG: hypothetical protein Q9182_007121, partial [Xanthomendoza sp. 2 TL-2023]